MKMWIQRATEMKKKTNIALKTPQLHNIGEKEEKNYSRKM